MNSRDDELLAMFETEEAVNEEQELYLTDNSTMKKKIDEE